MRKNYVDLKVGALLWLLITSGKCRTLRYAYNVYNRRRFTDGCFLRNFEYVRLLRYPYKNEALIEVEDIRLIDTAEHGMPESASGAFEIVLGRIV